MLIDLLLFKSDCLDVASVTAHALWEVFFIDQDPTESVHHAGFSVLPIDNRLLESQLLHLLAYVWKLVALVKFGIEG